MYRIGIDVGGTNTDAVIINENLSLFMASRFLQAGYSNRNRGGFAYKVMAESQIEAGSISHAMLGTTQCTNAIVERKTIEGRRDSSRLSCHCFR